MTDPVNVDTSRRIAIITIDRPEARNAVNAAVSEGIERGIDLLEEDDDLWVGILTGTPPAFSAGADLKEIGIGNIAKLQTDRGGFGGLVKRDRTKPLIAAVEGPAVAGGTELVLACDLVVAARDATFGLPEVKRSLLAGGGGLFRLPRKLPFNLAMECALTGDPIEAERAYQLGFVNDLCDPGQALERARALADRICENGPVAVRAARQVMLEAAQLSEEEGWRLSDRGVAAITRSEDVHEGVRAFIEKRRPFWAGR